MDKSKIIYVGPFSFPNGGAAARRILGISQSLMSLNYDVVIASGQSEEDSPENAVYKGIEVVSLNERTAEHMPRLLKHLLYFNMGSKTIDWLNSLDSKPEAIILYGEHTPYLIKLLPWCKSNKVPLIFDAVEWYDPPCFLHWFINPYYWNTEVALRFFIPKSKNVIAISKYLENYFKEKGCNTIKVPPTLDVESIQFRVDSKDKSVITLGYAGSPGHKDFFNNILEAFLQVDFEGRQLKLKVAGITEAQLLCYPAISKRKLRSIPHCIETVGVVSQEEALNLIRDVDFSVLLRANKRYAKAGFPTKFVESLAVGTPMIANHTSDLARYLIDGKTGIVCADEKTKSFKECLERILLIDTAQLSEMRLESRQMAEKSFSVFTVKDKISQFLGKV